MTSHKATTTSNPAGTPKVTLTKGYKRPDFVADLKKVSKPERKTTK